MIGMCIALSLGRNTSLDIAQAKAILLRRGKNSGALQDILMQSPIHFASWVFASSDIEGLHLGSSWGMVNISTLGLQPEG